MFISDDGAYEENKRLRDSVKFACEDNGYEVGSGEVENGNLTSSYFFRIFLIASKTSICDLNSILGIRDEKIVNFVKRETEIDNNPKIYFISNEIRYSLKPTELNESCAVSN